MITKNGRDHVVLHASEDLESIEATLELLSDAGAQTRVARAEQDIEAGRVLDEAAVRALLSRAAKAKAKRQPSFTMPMRTARRTAWVRSRASSFW